jgi:hypothetical protein
MAADYKFLSINPDDPTGDPVEIIIPGLVYERAYKEDRIHYENLRAAKFVLDKVSASSLESENTIKAGGALLVDHRNGIFENGSSCRFRRILSMLCTSIRDVWCMIGVPRESTPKTTFVQLIGVRDTRP